MHSDAVQSFFPGLIQHPINDKFSPKLLNLINHIVSMNL